MIGPGEGFGNVAATEEGIEEGRLGKEGVRGGTEAEIGSW
jgi:hypothetical protein